jgi:hypothetical protein
MADAMTDTEKLAELVFQSVKVYVDRKFAAATAPLLERLAAAEKAQHEWRHDWKVDLDQKWAGLEASQMAAMSAEDIDAAVTKALAAIELPKGEPGAPGEPGPAGKDAVIDDAEIEAAVERAVKAIEIVVPEAQHGKDGTNGTNGADGTHGRDGRDGDRGPPGRDAADLVVMASIDPERIYALGTWARHRGGLWKAMRDTDELRDGEATGAGWACVVEGFAGLSLTKSSDDGRTLTIAAELSSGRKSLHTVEWDSMIYRGIYEPGKEYRKGDVVTFAGSMLIAQRATSAMPETPAAGDDWRLAVKRGQNGKDAEGKTVSSKRDPVRL